MGVIVSLEEFRKKRCLEHLMDDIGMPRYCDECGDEGAEILFDALMGADGDCVPEKKPPAHLLTFPLTAQKKRNIAAANVPHGTAHKRKS